MKKNVYCGLFGLFTFLFISIAIQAQTYQEVIGWPDSTNVKLEKFMAETMNVPGRKVAVFDYDGTIFGQLPYYLADEAICQYADKFLADQSGKLSEEDQKLLDKVVHKRRSNPFYLLDRVKFFKGQDPQKIRDFAYDVYLTHYLGREYSEMRQLIANLKKFGFEIWVVSGSPEIEYEKVCYELFGIPPQNVIGSQTVISGNKITDEFVAPLPMKQGKADAIESEIKVKPLFVAGNSRGDLEMINESIGIKMVVNPNDSDILNDSQVKNQTLKEYWKDHGAMIVECKDEAPKDKVFSSAKYGVTVNVKGK